MHHHPSRFSLLVSLALALTMAPFASGFTPGGYDMVDAKAIFGLELNGSSELTVAGPLQIQREDPIIGSDGREEQRAEITGIELQGRQGDGSDPQADLFIALRLGESAPGYFRQQQAGQDFPADSSFSFLFHVVVGGDRLIAGRSVSLNSVVDEILPFQSCYVPEEPFQSVPLLDANGEEVGSLASIELCFGEHPTFSLPSSNPSGLNGADLYDVPTTKRLDHTALGLTPDDDVTSLSFGVDYVDSYMDVRFSVDPNTVGQPNTKVNEEATKSPSEAHGDEFQISPVAVVGPANRVQYQILDENGDTAPPFPLLIGDDVEALTEHPASFVDPDGNGQLDRPVYFTLSDSSPTLQQIGATPGDILVADGGRPRIFISHEELMLPEFNYIDAICVDALRSRVAYSLHPMSSLVTSRLRSAADVLSNIVPIPPGDFAFGMYNAFGLLEADNINALKCVLPEVDYYPNSIASINLNGEEVELTGYSRFVAGVLGDGRTGPGSPTDQVGVMADLHLSGASMQGEVNLFLNSSVFEGQVQESADVRTGFLDMPPFAPEGTGRLEMTARSLSLTIGERFFFLPSGFSSGVQFTADVTRKPINVGETMCAQEPFILEESSATSGTVMVSSLCVTPEQQPEAKPEFGSNSLLGGAAFGPAGAGGLASLFVGIADFIGDAQASASTVPLSAQLAQTTVEFTPQSAAATKEQGGGIAAPLVFVSGPANQVNLQIPWEIPPGIASVVVTAGGVASDAVSLAIAEFAPGIFSFDSGAGRAVAFYNDGAIVHPVGTFGLASRPAAIGDAFSVLATGLGPTNPAAVTGDSSSVGGTFVRRDTVAQATVTIGGVPAQVLASILSPEFVGVYQVAVIPQAGTPTGDAVPIVIDIGGEVSRADVTVAIAP